MQINSRCSGTMGILEEYPNFRLTGVAAMNPGGRHFGHRRSSGSREAGRRLASDRAQRGSDHMLHLDWPHELRGDHPWGESLW